MDPILPVAASEGPSCGSVTSKQDVEAPSESIISEPQVLTAGEGELSAMVLDTLIHRLSDQQERHQISIQSLLVDHEKRLKDIIRSNLLEERRATLTSLSEERRETLQSVKREAFQNQSVPNVAKPSTPQLLSPAPPASHGPPPLPEYSSLSLHAPPPLPECSSRSAITSHLPPPLPDHSNLPGTTSHTPPPLPDASANIRQSTFSTALGVSPTIYSSQREGISTLGQAYSSRAAKSLDRQSKRVSTTTLNTQAVEHLIKDDTENSEQHCWLRHLCRYIVQRREFEIAATLLIMVNTVTIGLSANYAVQNTGEDMPLSFRVVEIIFIIVFAGELFVRIVAEGIHFWSWRNVQFQWNIFDSVVVFAAGAEELLLLMVGSVVSLTYLRALRLLRIVRVLRVVRVMKFFSELRCMVAGIVNSLKALVWCIVLLMMLMYMFSLLFLQEIAANLTDNPAGGTEAGPNAGMLLTYFGSLTLSMETLLRSTTSGNSWGVVADALYDVSIPLGLLFTFYFSFVFFCVFNVVTSVFVENATSFTKMDLDNLALEESSRRNQLVEEMRGILNLDCDDDADESDEFSCYEFLILIQKPPVQAYFRHLGLHVARDNAGALFNLIDIDGSGSVSVGEFVDGCSQFVGQARQLDIARLRHELRMLSLLVTDFVEAAAPELGVTLETIPENPRESKVMLQPVRNAVHKGTKGT